MLFCLYCIKSLTEIDENAIRNENANSLNELNNDVILDCFHSLLSHFGNEDENPYNIYNFSSHFYDTESFVTKFQASKNPLFMNLNIQSLNSKHSNLEELSTNKVTIEILALQEIWNIPNLPSIEIPNYNFTFKKNQNSGEEE